MSEQSVLRSAIGLAKRKKIDRHAEFMVSPVGLGGGFGWRWKCEVSDAPKSVRAPR
ncbi:MAG: hypothetical protein RIS70_1735 [Planctomycetota bacterium]|jgi:hypothetical protein